MKILQVITSLRIGGAEKLITEIAPLLRDRGHEVDVCVFDGIETSFTQVLKDAGVKVISFGVNCNVYNPLFIIKLAHLMRGYDIVHTHNTACQIFAAIGSYFCKAKLVTTEHNTSNRRRDISWLKPIDRWMYRRYKKIICISDKAEDNLRKYLPKIENVSTIYNGVNVQKFYNAQAIKGLKSENKTIAAMVAAFRPQKDQDTLIKAFCFLPNDQYELWIIGDGQRRLTLEKLANGQENIKFLGIRQNIPELLHTVDIIIMSSHYEGLSLSSVEGMSVGKPFIATDVDGLKEVVEGYGILVPHGDTEALANSIRHLAEDKDYYQEVALKCWQRAQMFDIHKMINGYNKIYKEMIYAK